MKGASSHSPPPELYCYHSYVHNRLFLKVVIIKGQNDKISLFLSPHRDFLFNVCSLNYLPFWASFPCPSSFPYHSLFLPLSSHPSPSLSPSLPIILSQSLPPVSPSLALPPSFLFSQPHLHCELWHQLSRYINGSMYYSIATRCRPCILPMLHCCSCFASVVLGKAKCVKFFLCQST